MISTIPSPMGRQSFIFWQIPPVHLERVSANWKFLRFQEFFPGENNSTGLSFRLAEIFREIARLYEEKTEGYHLLVLSAVYRLCFFCIPRVCEVKILRTVDTELCRDLGTDEAV